MSDKLAPHLRSVRRIAEEDQGESFEINEGDRELPCGWASTKPVFSVSFEWPNGLKRAFRYIHLESDMTLYDGKIVMRFSGMKSYVVTIKGLRLEGLFNALRDDRMRSVRQAVREFDDGEKEPFVSSIVIDEEKQED